MEKELLETWLLERKTTLEMANLAGVNPETIRRNLHRWGIPLPDRKKGFGAITDQEFALLVTQTRSIRDLLRHLNRSAVGSNYRRVHRELERLGLDTSHWKPYGEGLKRGQKLSWDVILIENSPHRINSETKKRLISDHLLKEECYVCGAPPIWRDSPLMLVLDHINGKRNDSRIENLQLVCPNCNSQLSTFCGRNKTPTERSIQKKFCSCGSQMGVKGKTGVCSKCAHTAQRKVERPPREKLQEQILQLGFTKTGRIYGVSDNAVRKWLRN